MITLIQRVDYANVKVDGKIIGEIQKGLLAFVAIEKTDNKKIADRLLDRLLNYRIFSDSQNKMNLNIQDIHGGILLVPQFTLTADTKKGMRPSFSDAANPKFSQLLFRYLVKTAHTNYAKIAAGEFGANMKVTLCNDGPVTFLLKTN